ncbi:MAG: glycosyltransferase [Parasphingorhabdus sp.]|uniref:glycosyltransferase n=1 Tax=Parasphingorhabdus sp. TaxID=2709688 RepID=UPI0030036376
MKIVDVCAFYSPQGGGVKTYIRQKLAIGPSLGHEIVIIVPGSAHSVEEFGPSAKIVTIPGKKFPLDGRYHYFDDADEVHSALTRERPDYIEASSPWSSASIVADWPGAAPRSLIMHADPLSAYAYRWFGKIFARSTIDRQFDWFWRHLRRLDSQYDHVICAGDSLGERLRAGGLKRISTVPMGIEHNVFSASLRQDELRKAMLARCSLGPDATLLIAVGRHAAEKRWPLVIGAVTAAGAQRAIGLIQIGSGGETSRLKREARANPHIQFLKTTDDRKMLAAMLASADALIHGCEAETFCMVAAEARACGLPIIAPNQGGAADQVKAGAGLTYVSGDSLSATKAIICFADNSAELARQARAKSGNVQSMENHFRNLFGLYEARLEKSRAA